jgi:hypothetical protein
MDAKIIKALEVLKAVIAFYTGNQTKLDSKNSLKLIFQKLISKVNYIESLLPEKYKDHTVATILKNEWREKVVFSTLKIDNLLYIFHKNIEDKEQMKNFKSSKTSLNRKKDVELEIYAQELQNYCEALTPEKMQSIGIETSMIDLLKDSLTNYTNSLHKIHELIHLNVKAGGKIMQEIDKSNKIIQDLKRLIFAFFANDGTDLYDDFLKSAKIKSQVSYKYAIRGNISAADGGVIKRAHVMIRNEKIDQIVRSKQGNFVIRHLPPGVYVLEIVCDNYESQLHTISHVAGETNRLDVKLKRITEVEVAES